MAPTPEERRALLFLAFLIVTGSAVRFLQALSPRWTPDLVPVRSAPPSPALADTAGPALDAVAGGGPPPAARPEADGVAVEAAPRLPYRAGRLDLNAATAEDLAALPGIGEKLAARIVADRDAHGPYSRVEDLDRVPGIGPAKLARLSGAVYVGASAPR